MYALAETEVTGLMLKLLVEDFWPVLRKRSYEMIKMAPSGLTIYEYDSLSFLLDSDAELGYVYIAL